MLIEEKKVGLNLGNQDVYLNVVSGIKIIGEIAEFLDVFKYIEEAFKAHTGWDRHLPDPYFVKAGERMSEKFRDCTYPGMTIAASGFYGPQGRVLRMPLAMPDMLDTFESFRFGDLKVTNFEMEGSAIAGIAAHLGHNAGTVCCIIAHRHHKASNPDYKPQVRKLIELCLDKLAE